MRTIEARVAKLEAGTDATSRGRFIVLKGIANRGEAEVAGYLKARGIELQPNDITFDLAFVRPGTMERVDIELELVETILVTKTQDQMVMDAETFNRKMETLVSRTSRANDA